MEWWQSFFSGILCNILVAGTVWSTMATKHSIAKIFLIYFPIWLFAIVGFQHVTANSIIFSFGWTHADSPMLELVGQGVFDTPITLADWTFRSFFINMIPAMIGNWLSGAIFLPFVYFWLSDYHKTIKNQEKLRKQRELLNQQKETIEDQQETIEDQQETIESQQEFVQQILNSGTNKFPTSVDKLVIEKVPWYKRKKHEDEDVPQDNFSLYEDELSQNEIPNYDELFTELEDSVSADSLVKTGELNSNSKNKSKK
jgi:hypothetical protein